MNTQSDEHDLDPIMSDSPRRIPTYIGRPRRKDRSLIKDIKESVKEAISMNLSRKGTHIHTPSKGTIHTSVDLDDYQIIPTERDDEITDNRLEMQTQRTETDELRNNLNPTTAETQAASPEKLTQKNFTRTRTKDRFVAKSTILVRSGPQTLADIPELTLNKTISGNSGPGSRSSLSHWKKARMTLNAVKFSAGTQELLNKKAEEVMKGQTELEMKKKEWRMYMDPDSKFKAFWDTIITLTLLYYAIVTPYRWGLRIEMIHWKPLELSLDGIILLDIILMFITGITKRNKIVTDRKTIATKYLKRKFVFDLLACLPFYLWNNDLLFLKLLRWIHFGRATTLVRNFLAKKTRGGLVIFAKVSFILMTLFVLHLLICAWIFLGKADFAEKPTWFIQLQYQRSHVSVYLSSAFFIVTAASTVGYGDIVPENKMEMIISMVFEFCGTVVVAVCQSKILQILQQESYLSNTSSKAERELDKWLYEKERAKMNFVNNDEGYVLGGRELIRTMEEIHGYFRIHRANDFRGDIKRFGFFRNLNPKLQDEVVYRTFKNWIRKFHIFFDFVEDFAFTRELITELNPRAFYPFQKIIKRGTSPKGIYFILKGEVLITYENVALLTLPENSYFGDIILLDRNSSLNFIAGSLGARCLFIKKSEFLKLCARYPNVMDTLQSVAYRRAEAFRSVYNNNKSDNFIEKS